MECVSVDSEHVRRDSDEGANTRLAMDFARVAFYQKLALVPADSLASGSTDLKLLNMDMLVPVHTSRFVEPELEDNVFASVTSQVEAEGIQTLSVKGIRCRENNIRVDGHRHHRCVGSALKQIEITHVQAWILFRTFGIEMMGHRFPLCQCFIDYSRLYRRCAAFEVRKCLNADDPVRRQPSVRWYRRTPSRLQHRLDPLLAHLLDHPIPVRARLRHAPMNPRPVDLG